MRRRSRLGQAASIVLGSASVLLPFLVYVWSHLQIVTTGYEIEQTEARHDALEQSRRALRLELARLSALPRIEEQARKLGFVPLAPSRVLVVANRGGAPRLPPPLPTPSPAEPDR